MKVAVMGAGAVGCYYGGMLARAGHDVVLIARPRHVEAIRRNGLLLETLAFRESVQLQAETEPAAVKGAELVLFCVKSTDTDLAASAIAPYLNAGTQLLSLQNGIDNVERLREHGPFRVAAAAVYVAAEMAGEGHVRHKGRGELLLARAVLSDVQLDEFDKAGVPVLLTDNLAGTLWAKLIVNCACNAVSAITQQPYGVLWQSARIRQQMRDVVEECLQVASALQVNLPGDVWETVVRIMETMPEQRSSTAQDLAQGKKSEIEHLNGYVVRQAESLGLAVPVNRALLAQVRQLELRQTLPGD
jgi:2-dehydropantoate 2-reductase